MWALAVWIYVTTATSDVQYFQRQDKPIFQTLEECEVVKEKEKERLDHLFKEGALSGYIIGCHQEEWK